MTFCSHNNPFSREGAKLPALDNVAVGNASARKDHPRGLRQHYWESTHTLSLSRARGNSALQLPFPLSPAPGKLKNHRGRCRHTSQPKPGPHRQSRVRRRAVCPLASPGIFRCWKKKPPSSGRDGMKERCSSRLFYLRFTQLVPRGQIALYFI